MEMKLELVPVPVSDIDRAKAFYVENSALAKTSMFGPRSRSESSS
jgi:predicted enzyme related to lactoylglutathione lyase